MQHKRSVSLQRPQRIAQITLIGLMIALMLMTSACGGNPQTQQQASQGKNQLDSALRHAQDVGVPANLLTPIKNQETTLSNSSAPFSLFNDQAATDYYKNLATQYQKLQGQTRDAISNATNQAQTQAQRFMQNFQDALTARRTQAKGNLPAFTARYQHDQLLIAAAQYPKDFAVISTDAQNSTNALNMMGDTYNQLKTFQATITQMHKANIDVTAMQTQYQSDLDSFNVAASPTDFQTLTVMLSAQYQQAVVSSIQSIPYVGSAKLNTFQSQISDLKTYGMDASSYQKRYNADKSAMDKAASIHDYLVISKQIDNDISAMYPDYVQGRAHYLVNYIDKQARAWGDANTFHDKFDGKNYIQDSGYTMDGIGYWLNRELGWTYTTQDYQGVVDEENNQLFNLQMMIQNYSDKTPYNKPHATDTLMMDHYHLHQGQLIVVSLTEQALRYYVDGKLVKAIHVTTGRLERPSLPGVWTVQNRQAPTEFKSSDPPGSPYWYPPTPIHYAILYHWGGFFLHDSWWRADYGVGTQFPHIDSGGDQSFSGSGSHGCVNIQEDQAAWLYGTTNWNTMIAIY